MPRFTFLAMPPFLSFFLLPALAHGVSLNPWMVPVRVNGRTADPASLTVDMCELDWGGVSIAESPARLQSRDAR